MTRDPVVVSSSLRSGHSREVFRLPFTFGTWKRDFLPSRECILANTGLLRASLVSSWVRPSLSRGKRAWVACLWPAACCGFCSHWTLALRLNALRHGALSPSLGSLFEVIAVNEPAARQASHVVDEKNSSANYPCYPVFSLPRGSSLLSFFLSSLWTSMIALYRGQFLLVFVRPRRTEHHTKLRFSRACQRFRGTPPTPHKKSEWGKVNVLVCARVRVYVYVRAHARVRVHVRARCVCVHVRMCMCAQFCTVVLQTFSVVTVSTIFLVASDFTKIETTSKGKRSRRVQ